MFKRIAIAVAVIALLLATTLVVNVWRAGHNAVITTPGPYEAGQAQLHQQLLDTRQYESGLEHQAWNSGFKLHQLIDWHQQRIDKLTGNSQAAEILAYDRDSIARLQNRINELAQQQELAAEQAAAVQADNSATQPAAQNPPK